MNDSKQFLGLYIDKAVVDKVKQRAAKKDWSVNKWICHLIDRALRER